MHWLVHWWSSDVVDVCHLLVASVIVQEAVSRKAISGSTDSCGQWAMGDNYVWCTRVPGLIRDGSGVVFIVVDLRRRIVLTTSAVIRPDVDAYSRVYALVCK